MAASDGGELSVKSILYRLSGLVRWLYLELPRLYIERLGCVNHYLYHVSGPADRPVLMDPRATRNAYVNTLFHNRSGRITIESDGICWHDCMDPDRQARLWSRKCPGAVG